MSNSGRGCKGAKGSCGRDVYALGLCLTHYRRDKKGKSIDTPLRGYRGVDEQIVPTRVEKRIKDAIQAVCDQEGISEYEFMRRMLEDWYDSYKRVVPGRGSRGSSPSTTDESDYVAPRAAVPRGR
jgi:hypothetical protein